MLFNVPDYAVSNQPVQGEQAFFLDIAAGIVMAGAACVLSRTSTGLSRLPNVPHVRYVLDLHARLVAEASIRNIPATTYLAEETTVFPDS